MIAEQHFLSTETAAHWLHFYRQIDPRPRQHRTGASICEALPRPIQVYVGWHRPPAGAATAVVQTHAAHKPELPAPIDGHLIYQRGLEAMLTALP